MNISRELKSVLITGGSGFIGSNLIRYFFAKSGFEGKIINLDALTYAGNKYNLVDIEDRFGDDRYFFIRGDINDNDLVARIIREHDINIVIHLAAESHVDRSIHGPAEFIKTNLMGTFSLLEAVRECWSERDDVLFHHVSTDEVYGSLGETGVFTEDTAYDPRSPYSASKAGSDHLVAAYHHTYNIPVTISNCSNNYGPYQFPEKLIPLMILNMKENKPLPVYGDGKNVRDWVHVDDHNEGVWKIITMGQAGRTYNIGGGNEWSNINLVRTLCQVFSNITGCNVESIMELIMFVKDRPGHDRRYAIDSSRIKHELGWEHAKIFEEGLKDTVKWYLDNGEWVKRIQTGDYRSWIQMNYGRR